MNRLTDIFKILSDETRLRIMVLLFQEELCVCQLNGILDVPQPRISQNLSKLRDLKFVVAERKEKYVFYSLNKGNKELMNILKTIIADLELYPKLVADKNNLIEREKYLNQCSISCD